MAGSLPTTSPLKRAAVGERDGDPLGGVDHVMVRQDVAVAIDEEAGCRSPAAADSRSRGPGPSTGPSPRRKYRCASRDSVVLRRRIDVDDGRVDPLGDVREVDAPMGAPTRPLALRRPPHGRTCRAAAAWRPGACRLPHDEGHDQTHGGGEHDGDESETLGHVASEVQRSKARSSKPTALICASQSCPPFISAWVHLR